MFYNPENIKAEKIIFSGITADTVIRHPTAEIVCGYSGNRLFFQDRNSGTSYLIDSGAEISVLPSTPSD
ncbi:unnamed protein product [Hymenolepis diminuta]|uniref:Peptidase A2 domain-containing protein n=1 Tax=Hymenolepis diminuta TaxID=6216 RepID=A0A564Y7G5_HYMDI|nr:unnamed protein product [Hymenolepis diminuta]